MSPAAVEQASASTAQPPQGMPLHRLALQALAELRTGGPARKRRPKKQARRTGTSADAAVTEAPSKRSMSTKADAAPVVHPSPSQSYLRTANDPRVRILEPVSSLPSYLSPSSLHARRLVAPPRRQPPLLILDLNGTLVWRSKSRAWASANRRPSRRPYLGTFLDYVFSSALVAGQWRRRWEVMVWSSAQPHNVATMASWAGFDVSDLEKPTELETVTPSPAASESRQPAESTVEDVDALADRLADMSLKPPPQSRKPLAIWTRQHMDLNRRDYGQRVQTYKNLDKVWEKMRWTDPETGEEARWGPENTLLVDDSEVKAVRSPSVLSGPRSSPDAVIRRCNLTTGSRSRSTRAITTRTCSTSSTSSTASRARQTSPPCSPAGPGRTSASGASTAASGQARSAPSWASRRTRACSSASRGGRGRSPSRSRRMHEVPSCSISPCDSARGHSDNQRVR